MEKRSALVVGCGVSGLTCGVRLLEEGLGVTILAKAVPPSTTSDKAAAIWYPYRADPPDRVLAWSKRTFESFTRLSGSPGTGVSFTELLELFDRPVPDPWWKGAVKEFRRLGKRELPTGYRDGYAVRVPLIETPLYMRYLMNRLTSSGGEVEVLAREITDLGELGEQSSLIVNCTGLGAGKLCGDSKVFPIRGQVVRVTNPGIVHGIADESRPLELTYLVPRSADCILGGTAQENDWNEEVDEETSRQILERCQRLEPRLRGAKILGSHVGLRPGRSEVRLEIEALSEGCSVIHNYGHGGSGFTLSWGCAEDVVDLTNDSAVW